VITHSPSARSLTTGPGSPEQGPGPAFDSDHAPRPPGGEFGLAGTWPRRGTVAVRQTMKLPIKFIGVGEALDDLQPFDADTFVESLFS